MVTALQNRDGKPLASARSASLRGSVAVIPVCGPLSKQENWISQMFGAATYEGLAKDIQAALDDAGVTAIVLDVDSPGGDVSGCGELAAMIRAAAARKPVVAYASGLMCSAAYWLSSGATKIACDASATLGSIGVRTVMVDTTKMYESMGIKAYDIVCSQSPHKVADPANAEDRARVRGSLDAMASVFVDDVAKGRGVSAATVLADFGQGDVLIGQAAVDAGMADETGDLESLIAQLNSAPRGASPNAGANRMAKSHNPAVPAAVAAAEKCTRCARSMDDDDDVYCRACFGDDEAKHASFSAAVRTVLGAKDDSEALGALHALKIERDGLKVQIDALQAKQAQAEISALVADAVRDGRIPSAKIAEMEQLAAEHGVPALKACLGFLQPAPAPAAPASPATLAAANPLPTVPVSAESAELLGQINKRTGKVYTPEQMAKRKREMANYMLNSQDKE